MDTYGTIGGDQYSFSGCLGDPCFASSSISDDGSDGNFYCINGGAIGGEWNEDNSYCTCTSCSIGFSGPNCATCAEGYSGDDCSATNLCQATPISTDDGSDGNLYCINGGSIGGTAGSCTCTCVTGFAGDNCQNIQHFVADMTGVWDLVSNGVGSGYDTGTSIMINGDTAALAVGSYKCSEGTCAHNDNMLNTVHLSGGIKCAEDNASCVLDGENSRRALRVSGTGSGTLNLRALTIKDGQGGSGGGAYIREEGVMSIELCVFSNCVSTSSSRGGGAIRVYSGTLNFYGTGFNNNYAGFAGDDIHLDSGEITIHSVCPSPYASFTPTQGNITTKFFEKFCCQPINTFLTTTQFLPLSSRRICIGHLWFKYHG